MTPAFHPGDVAIPVERDAEGLRMALRGIFEESFVRDASKRLPEDVRESQLPRRELSPGYYARASYLLGLASSIERGCRYDAAMLSHLDVLGLEAVSTARGQFESDHPRCGSCGARQYSAYMHECSACHAKFARGAD